MQHRDFWDSIIEQIEQFRRANRFGTVQLKIRNHEIVHFEMTSVMRGELPKRSFRLSQSCRGDQGRNQRERAE